MKKISGLIWLICLLSCDEAPSEISIDPGYEYFPLNMGQYRIYEVEAVTYQAFSPDTSRYYLRETISDSLVSGDGSVRYLLTRAISMDQEVWKTDSIWSVQRHQDVIVQYENNVPFVKLVFPVKVGRTWDGNAFNTRDELTYFYSSESNYSMADSVIGSDQVIRVILSDIPQNLVNQDQRSEVYARGIGLVEKDYTYLSFCSVNCDELGAIEKGNILKQKLIAYGRE